MIAQPARIVGVLALTITSFGLLSACSSTPERPSKGKVSAGSYSAPRTVGESAAAIALNQVGVPYRYGGSSPSGFDCSGLVQYSYSLAGKRLPRTTKQLWTTTDSVGRNDLRAGDLLFFRIEGKMSHVGVYLGKRRFVHAPASGRTVTVASIDAPFYEDAFLRGGRVR